MKSEKEIKFYKSIPKELLAKIPSDIDGMSNEEIIALGYEILKNITIHKSSIDVSTLPIDSAEDE
jgi:hypothetical protein